MLTHASSEFRRFETHIDQSTRTSSMIYHTRCIATDGVCYVKFFGACGIEKMCGRINVTTGKAFTTWLTPPLWSFRAKNQSCQVVCPDGGYALEGPISFLISCM